jgi:hypothetical protein
MRFAYFPNHRPNEVEPYLPANYSIVGPVINEGVTGTVIAGFDNAGWTLEDYVLPRAASGLIFGKELVEEGMLHRRP